jgi:hypothetical protein
MAIKPADALLTTWIGTGAATTSPASATSGYFIPTALVSKYVGSGGADASISTDIRDFLFSILSKCEESYNVELPSGDTRTTSIVVTKSVSTLTNSVTFSVRLTGVTVTQPSDYITTLPTWA